MTQRNVSGSTMRAVVVTEPNTEFEVTERPIPEPDADEVRVAVEACGVCGGDTIIRTGEYHGDSIDYPRIPGHEVVGRIDSVGEDVTEWAEGERVGVGWHGGHCFTCDACRRGEFRACENATVTGIDHDGGYAEYTVVPHETVARVPESLDATGAAPLLCAGLTTFGALRNSPARMGSIVAVVGIGGLGHLALQYAHAAGFETVAVSRGTDKESYAYDLGADHYIDSTSDDPASALQELGGASVILSTVPVSAAIESVVGGLATGGEVVSIGAPEEPVGIHIGHLVGTRGAVGGWAAGSTKAAEDTLEFSERRNTIPEIEKFDLADAEVAYQRMVNSEIRFRAVLEP